MFRKKAVDAPMFWIATSDLPTTPANAFFQRLEQALADMQFGDAVRRLAAPYYAQEASKGGQPGIAPEVYFKMLLVGFFENLPSERAIAARCADSLAIRAFLRYGLTERTPHHSSLTVIRQRLGAEVYTAVFTLILQALKAQRLLKGKHLLIDSSVLAANASLRSLRHRVTGERYREYVQRLAQAAGVDPTDARAVNRFDRQRRGRKTSNRDWRHPHDPDAKIGPDKKKVTRMLYKPEHVVDADTGAIVHVELRPGDAADATGLAERIGAAEARVNAALAQPPATAQVEAIGADLGYADVAEQGWLQAGGIRTAIGELARKRDAKTLPPEVRQILRRAQQTRQSQRGVLLRRRRGELCERSFVHVLDYGGARRTTLRGRENIGKRYFVQAAGTNLALLLRTRGGVGTLKQMWAAAQATLTAGPRAIRAHLRRWSGRWGTAAGSDRLYTHEIVWPHTWLAVVVG